MQIGPKLNKRKPVVFCSILHSLDFCSTLTDSKISLKRDYGFAIPMFIKAVGFLTNMD